METSVRKYKGLNIKITRSVVTQEDVDREIAYLLSQRPVTAEKEGPLKNGDTSVIDFEGFKDGVAFDGGKGSNYELTIGSHTFIPGFEEQMIGMQIGESRDLHLSFPETYGEPSLAGAAVVFKVTLHRIIEKKPAELNDAFAASLDLPNVKTVEELKGYAFKALEAELNRREAQETQEAIFRELLKFINADPDQELVDTIAKNHMESVKQQLSMQGLTLEQYLAYVGESADSFENEAYLRAEEQLKLQMGLDWIADQENITADEFEVEVGYSKLAEQYQTSIEEVKKNVSQESVAKDIRMAQAIEFVKNNAVIEEVEKKAE